MADYEAASPAGGDDARAETEASGVEDTLTSDLMDGSEAEGIGDDEDLGDELEAEGGDDSPDGEAVEEVEWEDGKKYQVPKAIKDALMRDRDYRHKTMELAEQRRDFESKQAEEAAAIVQRERAAFDELRTEHVKVARIEARLDELNKLDWSRMRAEEPDLYRDLRDEQRDVERELERARGDLTTKNQAFEKQQADKLGEAQQHLASSLRDVPGWGPELASQAAKFAVEEVGVQPEELKGILDPRVWKLFVRASKAEAELKTLKTAQNKAKAQSTRPAATVRGGSGRFAASPDTDDFAAFERLADQTLKPS